MNGFVLEEIDGMATEDEDLYLANDNNGVNNPNGEARLISIK